MELGYRRAVLFDLAPLFDGRPSGAVGLFPRHSGFGVVSFLANLYFTFGNASKGFYWPFGRFWELLVGASAALLLLRQPVIEKPKGPILGGRRPAFIDRVDFLE